MGGKEGGGGRRLRAGSSKTFCFLSVNVLLSLSPYSEWPTIFSDSIMDVLAWCYGYIALFMFRRGLSDDDHDPTSARSAYRSKLGKSMGTVAGGEPGTIMSTQRPGLLRTTSYANTRSPVHRVEIVDPNFLGFAARKTPMSPRLRSLNARQAYAMFRPPDEAGHPTQAIKRPPHPDSTPNSPSSPHIKTVDVRASSLGTATPSEITSPRSLHDISLQRQPSLRTSTVTLESISDSTPLSSSCISSSSSAVALAPPSPLAINTHLPAVPETGSVSSQHSQSQG